MGKGICSVVGCDRGCYMRGWCGMHYARVRRTGEVGSAEPKGRRRYPSTCSLDGCERDHYSKGWCELHYRRVAASGEPGPVSNRLYAWQLGDTCAGPECDRPAQRRSLCGTHYTMQHQGRELKPIRHHRGSTRGMSLPERVAHYSAEPNENGCRLWLGPVDGSGYGSVVHKGKTPPAHRVAWELANGETIPKGMQIHHACATPLCVEPSHLQLITQRENKAEMLERKYYTSRIAELEAELAALKSA